jgi:SNF2 family DNA or RNA helicase
LTFVPIDPEDLERVDVVLTTYDVVANEWAARGSADEKPSARKVKESVVQDGDSDSDGFGGDLKKRKEALLAAAKGSKPKKAVRPHDALFQVTFLRVVVDEVRFPIYIQERPYQYFTQAQNIKGRKTKRSLACSALRSKYRWVLSELNYSTREHR